MESLYNVHQHVNFFSIQTFFSTGCTRRRNCCSSGEIISLASLYKGNRKWTLRVNLRTIVRPLADWSCGAARIRVMERGWMTMMRTPPPQSNNYCPVMSRSNEHEKKARERSLAFYCSLDWLVCFGSSKLNSSLLMCFDVQWLWCNQPYFL